jgi:hypothetical protein
VAIAVLAYAGSKLMCCERSRGGYVRVELKLRSIDEEWRIEIDRFFSYRPGGEWAGPTKYVGPPFPLPHYFEQLPETSFTELTRS